MSSPLYLYYIFIFLYFSCPTAIAAIHSFTAYIYICIQCNYLEPPNPTKVLPIRSLLPILSNSFPACMFLTCSKYIQISVQDVPHLSLRFGLTFRHSFPRFPFPFRPSPAAPSAPPWWEAAAAPRAPAAGPAAPPSAAGPPPAECWRAPGGSWPRPWKGLPGGGAPAQDLFEDLVKMIEI